MFDNTTNNLLNGFEQGIHHQYPSPISDPYIQMHSRRKVHTIPLLDIVELSEASCYQCYKQFWKQLDNTQYLVIFHVVWSFTSCILCEIKKVSCSSPLSDKYFCHNPLMFAKFLDLEKQMLTTWLVCIKCNLTTRREKVKSFYTNLPRNSSKFKRLVYAILVCRRINRFTICKTFTFVDTTWLKWLSWKKGVRSLTNIIVWLLTLAPLNISIVVFLIWE